MGEIPEFIVGCCDGWEKIPINGAVPNGTLIPQIILCKTISYNRSNLTKYSDSRILISKIWM